MVKPSDAGVLCALYEYHRVRSTNYTGLLEEIRRHSCSGLSHLAGAERRAIRGGFRPRGRLPSMRSRAVDVRDVIAFVAGPPTFGNRALRDFSRQISPRVHRHLLVNMLYPHVFSACLAAFVVLSTMYQIRYYPVRRGHSYSGVSECGRRREQRYVAESRLVRRPNLLRRAKRAGSRTGKLSVARTAVSFWGQTIQTIKYSLSPKRDCGSKGVKTAAGRKKID